MIILILPPPFKGSRSPNPLRHSKTAFRASYSTKHQTMSSKKTLLSIGIIGSIVAAACCFTSIFAVLLGVVGLSAIGGILITCCFLHCSYLLGFCYMHLHAKQIEDVSHTTTLRHDFGCLGYQATDTHGNIR